MNIPDYILLQSIHLGITEAEITTAKAVKLINRKGWNKAKLIEDRYAVMLGRHNRSKGYKPYYKFDTVKVLKLKIKLEENSCH